MLVTEGAILLPGDLERWQELERDDGIYAVTSAFRSRCTEALRVVVDFVASGGPSYAGTSWGKDSTVLAHLIWCAAEELGIEVPLVHVDCRPINNPHCHQVAAAFLERWPTRYHEEVIWCRREPTAPVYDYCEGWHASGTLETAFASVARQFGDRYLSGIRGAESASRRKRMRYYGHSTAKTCAPLGYWSARDVYAYLYAHDLPVHPAYAQSLGGVLDRDRLRVAFLGLRHGTEFGRHELETVYYPRIRTEMLEGTPT